MSRRRAPHPLGTSLLLAAVWAVAGHAESYAITATNALAVDREGRLVQSWQVGCVGDNPGADAAISLSGKDLRFFVAEEEPLEVGVDAVTHVLGEVGGRYEYDIVPGARVMARLTARCGTADVFDTITVDSAPVTLAPAVSGPDRLVVADTFTEVDDDALPVGLAVELVGLRVEGAPRGTEVVTVVISGAGVDVSLPLGPTDFSDGVAVIAPRIVAEVPGPIEVRAELLGVSSSPLTLGAVNDDGDDDPEPLPGDTVEAGAGCASHGGEAPLGVIGLLGVLGMARRGRRRHARG